MGCLLPLHMMILMNIICMCLLLLLAIIMREELHLRLSMFPTRKNCKKLLMLCIGLYLMCMNCSFMTCRCIGRELDFVIVTPPCNVHSDQLLIMPCHHHLQCQVI